MCDLAFFKQIDDELLERSAPKKIVDASPPKKPAPLPSSWEKAGHTGLTKDQLVQLLKTLKSPDIHDIEQMKPPPSREHLVGMLKVLQRRREREADEAMPAASEPRFKWQLAVPTKDVTVKGASLLSPVPLRPLAL